MRYYTRDDIYKASAREAGVTKELMEFIVKNLFQSVRSLLTNPLENWKGVLLNGFIRLYLQPTTVEEKKEIYKKDILEQLHQNLKEEDERKKRK